MWRELVRMVPEPRYWSPPEDFSTTPNPVIALPGSTPITRITTSHTTTPSQTRCGYFLRRPEMGQFFFVYIEICRDALHIVVVFELFDQLQHLLSSMP